MASRLADCLFRRFGGFSLELSYLASHNIVRIPMPLVYPATCGTRVRHEHHFPLTVSTADSRRVRAQAPLPRPARTQRDPADADVEPVLGRNFTGSSGEPGLASTRKYASASFTPHSAPRLCCIALLYLQIFAGPWLL